MTQAMHEVNERTRTEDKTKTQIPEVCFQIVFSTNFDNPLMGPLLPD